MMPATKNIVLLGSITIIVSCLFGTESFIIPPKKNVSASALRQEFMHVNAQTLQLLIELSGVINAVQRVAFDSEISMIAGDTKSPLTRAKRPEMQALLEEVGSINAYLETVVGRLGEYLELRNHIATNGLSVLNRNKDAHIIASVPAA